MYDVEIAYDNQKIVEKLNSYKINSDIVLSRLKVDTGYLTTQQDKLTHSSNLYTFCEALKSWSPQQNINFFTNYINNIIYHWLNAIDEGVSLETTATLINCFSLKNRLGKDKSPQFGQFIQSILLDSLNRYYQVSIDYAMNFDQSVEWHKSLIAKG